MGRLGGPAQPCHGPARVGPPVVVLGGVAAGPGAALSCDVRTRTPAHSVAAHPARASGVETPRRRRRGAVPPRALVAPAATPLHPVLPGRRAVTRLVSPLSPVRVAALFTPCVYPGTPSRSPLTIRLAPSSLSGRVALAASACRGGVRCVGTRSRLDLPRPAGPPCPPLCQLGYPVSPSTSRRPCSAAVPAAAGYRRGIPSGTGLGSLCFCRSCTSPLIPLHSSPLLTAFFFFFRRGRCSSPVMAAPEARDRPYARMLDGQYQLIRSFSQYHGTLTAARSRSFCCAVRMLASSRSLYAAASRLEMAIVSQGRLVLHVGGSLRLCWGAWGRWWALHWLCAAVRSAARAVGRSVGGR